MFLANKGQWFRWKSWFGIGFPDKMCIPSCWGSVCFQQPQGTVFVSPLFQIFPQMSLHVFATGQATAMTACTFFYPVWRGSPFGITPKTQYMLRPSLTDVATKQKCRDLISHHGNACHMHKIDQNCTSCYKQKDWMQKMFAFINLKTFLPDCMKNRRTASPVTECRWWGRRHCQGQGWYPKCFN